jgi:hypothetical protein
MVAEFVRIPGGAVGNALCGVPEWRLSTPACSERHRGRSLQTIYGRLASIIPASGLLAVAYSFFGMRPLR